MRSLGVRSPGVCKTRGLVVDGYVKNEEPRSQGVENTGSIAKHGVWCKTRGVVENTESKWKARDLSRKQGVPSIFFFILFYFSQ